MALQQKVIDGAENSPITLFTSKHWEVCKVYSLTEHFWLPCPLLASKKWWDGLPKDIQAQVRAAGTEAEQYGLRIYAEDESKVMNQLKREGFRSSRISTRLLLRGWSSRFMTPMSSSRARTSWTRSGEPRSNPIRDARSG